MWGNSYYEYLQKHELAKDWIPAPHDLHFRGHGLRFEANMQEAVKNWNRQKARP